MTEARPVTQILSAIQQGDSDAPDRLLPLVYDELRLLAAQKLSREPAGQTLQATALVHEAYLRLVDAQHQQQWDSRGHFFAAAAEAMRRIIVERARRKLTQKHGGDRKRVALDNIDPADDRQADQLLAINEVLDELELHDPQSARLVKLRFFAGFGHQETAKTLGISRRAADRLWVTAKAWIYSQIKDH